MVWTWLLPASIFREPRALDGEALETLVLQSTAAQTAVGMRVYWSTMRFGSLELWRPWRRIVDNVSVLDLFLRITGDQHVVSRLGLERMTMDSFHQVLYDLLGFQWYVVVWGQDLSRRHLNAYLRHPHYEPDVWDRWSAYVGAGTPPEQDPASYHRVPPRSFHFEETLRMLGWEQPNRMCRL